MAKYEVTGTFNDVIRAESGAEAIETVRELWENCPVNSLTATEVEDDTDVRDVLENTLPLMKKMNDTLSGVGVIAINSFNTVGSFDVQMMEDDFFRTFKCFAVEKHDDTYRRAYVKIGGVEVFTLTTEEKINEQF